MEKKREKLPEFESVDEEVEFWEDHDVTDFLDELEDLDDVEYKQGKDRVVSVRWPQGTCRQVESLCPKPGDSLHHVDSQVDYRIVPAKGQNQ